MQMQLNHRDWRALFLYTLARGLIVTVACLGLSLSLTSKARSLPPWQCDQSPILIRNTTLWTSDGPNPEQNIFLENGRIAWIDTSERMPDVTNYRVIDAKGTVTLPGLIDAHVHFDALGAAKASARQLDVMRDIFPITMRQTLASGVTSARVHLAALSEMALMNRIASDPCFPSPRLAISGPGLLGGAPGLDARLMRGVTGPEDAAAKVRQMGQLGASWLALHRPSGFSEAELASIKAEAARLNIRILADTDAFEDLRTALEQGFASGEYINRSGAADYPEDIKKLVAAKAPSFVSVAPIGYYHRIWHYQEKAAFLLNTPDLQFVPESLRDQMQKTFAADFREDTYIAEILASYPTMDRKFHSLILAGASLPTGSDSGSLGQFHGEAIWWELKARHAYGLPASEIIDAATTFPANLMGWKDAGHIAPGAFGDLVLYTGDIEEGGFDRRHVRDVVKGGVLYVRDYSWVGPKRQQMVNHLTE